jgi:hypothetical protein
MRSRRLLAAQSFSGLALGLLLLGACDSGTSVNTSDPSNAATSSAQPSASPSATAAPVALAVYYLVDTGGGPRLAREFRQVARTDSQIGAAVDAMLRLAPLDPDYSSLWPKTTRVLDVDVDGDLATIDLSPEAATANAGSSQTAMSLQQLVHVVTAAAPQVAKVVLHIDGKPATDLWGHVDAGKPTGRGPSYEVLAQVQIDDPADGSTVGRALTFKGAATVPEANVSWRITAGCPKDVTCPGTPEKFLEGFVTASQGGPGRGTWSVTVTLPDAVFETSGYIEIRAFYASDNDGSEQNPDTKVVLAKA